MRKSYGLVGLLLLVSFGVGSISAMGWSEIVNKCELFWFRNLQPALNYKSNPKGEVTAFVRQEKDGTIVRIRQP